ncbi:MAG: hypothetical protein V1851_00150 [Patescibacteria group bacterium]
MKNLNRVFGSLILGCLWFYFWWTTFIEDCSSKKSEELECLFFRALVSSLVSFFLIFILVFTKTLWGDYELSLKITLACYFALGFLSLVFLRKRWGKNIFPEIKGKGPCILFIFL